MFAIIIYIRYDGFLFVNVCLFEYDTGANVRDYFYDTVGPYMSSFALDMNQNLLIMTFNGPINTDTFDPTAIQMQSRYYSNNGVSYKLTGGVVVSFTLFTVTLLLTDADILAIKKTDGLCRNQESSYLIATSNLCIDVLGNPFQPIIDSFALPCTTFFPDTVSPRIIEINVNANLNTLQIIFDKPIQLRLVDVTAIYYTLLFSNEVNTTVLPNVNYQLTLESTLHNPTNLLFATEIVIDIGDPDANGIKSLYPLLSSQQTTFFYITSSMSQDVFGNPLYFDVVHPVYKTNGFIADITRPSVQQYELDMSAGSVKFIFSKAVSPLSLDLSLCFISNATDRRYDPYTTLAGADIFFGLSTMSNELTLYLSTSLINFMKYYTIGILQSKSWLSYYDTFISDYVGNYLPPHYDVSVVNSSPRAPDTFTPDLIPPILKRWYIDRTVFPLNIQIFFNEPILLSDYSQISFYAQDGNNDVIQLNFPLHIRINNSSNSNTTNTTSTNTENQFTESVPSALSTTLASSLPARLAKQQRVAGTQNGNMVFNEYSTVIELLVDYPCPANANYCPAISSVADSPYLDTSQYRLYLLATKSTATDMANNMNQLTPIIAKNPLYESTPGAAYVMCCAYYILLYMSSVMLLLYIAVDCQRIDTIYNDNTCIITIINYYIVFSQCCVILSLITIMMFVCYPLIHGFALPCIDCTPCSNGFYLKTGCTHDTDKVCLPCSSCSPGQYVYQLCSSKQDTLCHGRYNYTL